MGHAPSKHTLLAFLSMLVLLVVTIEPATAFSSRYRLNPTRNLRRTSRNAYTASPNELDEHQRRWFGLAKSKPTTPLMEEETDQSDAQAVDQYLEFLDRRYRQIHDDEEKTTIEPSQNTEKTTFSAWKWLKQEPLTDAVTSQKEQEDALYVLGVAGLASKKLLQKHHMPAGQQQTQSVHESTPAVIDIPTPAPQTNIHPLVQQAARRLVLLALLRHRLIRYQTRKLKQCAHALAKGPVQLVRKAWAGCGGKRNVMVTAAIAATVLVVLVKALVQVVVREGAGVQV